VRGCRNLHPSYRTQKFTGKERFFMQTSSHVQEHVETIAKHEQEFLANRSASERFADHVAVFAGSIWFVALHLAFFAGWITLNTIQGVAHFDPSPFPMLDTCVALEAILLASFILMRQSGLAKRADERDHLMLQILLLTEREVSALVRMTQQMAEHDGLRNISKDPEIRELGKPTSIDEVAQTIQESLSQE
jgi:uncharacterized membrane protein